MKRMIAIVLLLFAFGINAAQEGAKPASGGGPPKPLQTSQIGYLTVTGDSVQIQPPQAKFFIMPQTELPLLEETQESYLLLLNQETGSFYGLAPKQKRYSLVMELTDGIMRFKGGIELKAMPIPLKKGEELPITRQDEKGYLVILTRQKETFNILIPRDAAGLSFDKHSAFEKFAETQKQKNLSFYEGAWIPAQEAETQKQEAARIEADKGNQWQVFLQAATQGYLVRKNGQLLIGKLKGQAERQLLFESSGTELWLCGEDLMPLPLEQILSKGNLFTGNAALSDARACFRKNDLGETSRYIEKSQAALRKIDASTPDDYNSALGKLKELGELQKDLDALLKEDGSAIYQNQVFPADELRHHLSANHILFKGKIWLLPDQPCARCKGEGNITCQTCKGVGTLTFVCGKCKQGIADCPICEGSGWKQCFACKGNGGFPHICTKCAGTGMIWKTIVSRGGTIIYTPGGGAMFPNGPATSAGGAEAGSAGFSYKYVEEQCPLCQGTGEEKLRCADCGGNGKLKCPKTQTCAYCKGKGIITNPCETCNGQKKLACPDCLGKGYKGEPQTASPPKKSQGTNDSSPQLGPTEPMPPSPQD